jgi:hypothetical protein
MLFLVIGCASILVGGRNQFRVIKAERFSSWTKEIEMRTIRLLVKELENEDNHV